MNSPSIVPRAVENWTYETVLDVVRRHDFEPGWFDFKETFRATRGSAEDLNASIRRTVCSMANTNGGYLIFGVRDRLSGGEPQDRIVGIPLGGDLRKEFGDKLRPIQPDIYFETSPRPVLLPQVPARGVFLVRIPWSVRRPHMLEPDGVFYRRSEGGSAEPMRLQEVREQMLFTEERLRRATLFRIQLALFIKMAKDLEGQGKAMVNAMRRFDTAAYSSLLADVCVLLPPDANLLQRLLDIPLAASRVNLLFDRYTSTNAGLDWTVLNASGDLRDIVWTGQECESKLLEILGPLGANTR